ncbi:SPW repeat domain-containing protein [Litchfieldella xinjiangensis]|uniref:SPW repeat domain-containing protein n=1 Tax=Litchfieldella xinjiangensis TaxID=1166948 RepID=UPI0005BAAFF7|nr:SPW repeat protein [Halomonas xinjiangensis]
MRFISTRVHGLVDYPMGLLLIAAPFLFGFATGGAAQWVPIILGVIMVASAVMTKYELGLMHLIPMPIHLTMDLVSGILLLVSPWLFGFADTVYLPHVILGLLEIGASLTTEKQPRDLPATANRT